MVWSALRALGAEIEEPVEKNKEDGWIKVVVDGQTYEGVLEIKSTKNDQFGEDGRKQLLDWIDRGITLRSKKYKGLFFGNSCVQNDPTERPVPFSDSWKKAAELSEICALTTTQLFVVFVLHAEGRLDGASFWKDLFETNGIFDVQKYLPPPST